MDNKTTFYRIYNIIHGVHNSTKMQYFTGIDMLGDYLIEINVTSPTCLQEMNRLYNKSLENDVIHFVENEIKRRSK